jgi:hypothetical protein
MKKSLLTLSSAARYIDIPRSTLRYWVLLGYIRKHVYGGVWFVDAQEAATVKQNLDYRPRRREPVLA